MYILKAYETITQSLTEQGWSFPVTQTSEALPPRSPSLGNLLPEPAKVDPKSWAAVVNSYHHISMNFIPFVYLGYHQDLGSQRAGKEGQGGGMLLAKSRGSWWGHI